jgi:hypothetical protein
MPRGRWPVYRRIVIIAVGLVALALAAGGAAVARGTGPFDDDDPQIGGPAADRARAAAVDAVGGGRATSVERDSDSAYEVEVTKADGATVDVDLDESFGVVAVDDAENPAAPGDANDDVDEDDEAGDAPDDVEDDDGADDDAGGAAAEDD